MPAVFLTGPTVTNNSLCFLAVAETVASTHCAYPCRDGQAELAWVAGYIPGQRRSPIRVLTGLNVE